MNIKSMMFGVVLEEIAPTRPQSLGVSNSYQAGVIHLSLKKNIQ